MGWIGGGRSPLYVVITIDRPLHGLIWPLKVISVLRDFKASMTGFKASSICAVGAVSASGRLPALRPAHSH